MLVAKMSHNYDLNTYPQTHAAQNTKQQKTAIKNLHKNCHCEYCVCLRSTVHTVTAGKGFSGQEELVMIHCCILVLSSSEFSGILLIKNKIIFWFSSTFMGMYGNTHCDCSGGLQCEYMHIHSKNKYFHESFIRGHSCDFKQTENGCVAVFSVCMQRTSLCHWHLCLFSCCI